MSYVEDYILTDPCFYNDPNKEEQLMDYSKFDSMVDLDGLKKDIADAEQNGGGEYKDVPHGEYEVSIEKLELRETKKTGKPMMTCWMKIVSDGEYKGQMLFMNQVITQGFQIHICDKFLRSLVEDMDGAPDVSFESYTQYAELLMDVLECVSGKREFAVKYGETAKGFDTFEVTEIFDLD